MKFPVSKGSKITGFVQLFMQYFVILADTNLRAEIYEQVAAGEIEAAGITKDNLLCRFIQLLLYNSEQ
jgi:hypothetical protein